MEIGVLEHGNHPDLLSGASLDVAAFVKTLRLY